MSDLCIWLIRALGLPVWSLIERKRSSSGIGVDEINPSGDETCTRGAGHQYE